MSGTSLDGIDLAYCRFSEGENGWDFELLNAETLPFPEKWAARLMAVDIQNAEVFAKTNVYFGHFLGQTVNHFQKKHQIQPEFVASHGQTIFHQPDRNFTCQIGDGESIAAYLKCPVVTNFRNKDVAAGGQGAPLVPFGEKHLFPGRRLFLNLGGFANLTIGDIAFDVGACNIILNRLACEHDPDMEFDPGGEIARSGGIHLELLYGLDSLPYYRLKPPKSLGVEWLEAELSPLLSDPRIPAADRMNTYCRHLARQVALAAQKTGARNEEIVITGGGAKNRFLMELLKKELAPLGVTVDETVSEEIADFKEAIIFGFLGLMTLLGRTNTLSSGTGARQDICGGSIHLPPGGWGVPLI